MLIRIICLFLNIIVGLDMTASFVIARVQGRSSWLLLLTAALFDFAVVMLSALMIVDLTKPPKPTINFPLETFKDQDS